MIGSVLALGALRTPLNAPLLRQALLADAVTSGLCAGLLLGAAGPLSELLGLPTLLLRGAGALLLPFAALVGALSLRERLPRSLVFAVIGVNLVWALDSLLLLAGGFVRPTAAGIVFVLAQALVVALYAGLQIAGWRRARTGLSRVVLTFH